MSLLFKLLQSKHEPDAALPTRVTNVPIIRPFTEREAALQARHDAINAQANREIEALQRRIAEVNARASEEHASADHKAHEHAGVLLQELIRDARTKLTPLVTDWRIAPTRPLAVALGAELKLLMAREQEEIPTNGTSRALLALGNIFADALIIEHPAAINMFGTSNCGGWSPRYLGALSAIAKAVGSPPALYSALEAFETEITRIALSQDGTPYPHASARWALIRNEDLAALAALDAATQQEEHARFCASYNRPSGRIHSSGEAFGHEPLNQN